MSWFSDAVENIFPENSYEYVVPDSYVGAAVCGSWQQPVLSYGMEEEEEACSYIQYRDNTVPLDLNIPAEEPFAQQEYDYPNYEYGANYAELLDLNLPAANSYGQHTPEKNEPLHNEHVSRDGGEQEEPLNDHEGSFPVIVSFETNDIFSSREEMVKWVKKRGMDHGYVIKIGRSKDCGEATYFTCTLGGRHKSVATVRKTGSKKIGCPFKLRGSFNKYQKVWSIEVQNPYHNHSPIENLEGHAYARRLSTEDKRVVEDMVEQNIPKRSIWATLMKKNPDRPLIPKDIHNVAQKINAEKRVGESPMQQLESLLVEKNFTYYTSENQATNAVENIFFVHPHSYTMWCAFSHVLLIDATYKTNIYNLPFVQVVGMTSTNQSFAVAHAFISAEKVENYVWVLEKIKSMLVESMEPRVILTDRELALMNACDKVFPNACKYLCRFHILQNINRNAKKKFTGKEWNEFVCSFATLCESTTEEVYRYNLVKLEARLKEIGRDRKYILHSYIHTFSQL